MSAKNNFIGALREPRLSTTFGTGIDSLVGLVSTGYIKAGKVYETSGANTEGDGGGAKWKCISTTTTGVSEGFDSNGVYYVDIDGTNFAGFEVIAPFSALAMGGDADAVLGAAATGKYVRGGSLALSSNVNKTLVDGVSTKIDLDSVSGQYSISLNGVVGSSVSASDVSRFDKKVTVSDASSFSVGEYIRVDGTVGHEDYTPSRYTDAKIVLMVTEIDGLNIYVDMPIDYILTSVTVSPVQTCGVDIKITSSDSVQIGVFNVPKAAVNLKSCTGNVGEDSGQKFLHVTNAHSIAGSVNMNDATFINGVRLEDISAGEFFVQSTHGGSDNDCKTFRANGLRNMTVSVIATSSMWKDIAVRGARNCNFSVTSSGSGEYFFRNGITTGNRLESVIFLESDRVPCVCNISEANDQAFEYLSCTDSKCSGYIHQSSATTNSEGCVVFKQASRDLILDATVRAHDSVGVKLENLNGMMGVTIAATSDIYSENNLAVVSRDAASAYNNGHRIAGRMSRGSSGVLVELQPDNDDTIVNIDADMTNATTAVQVANDSANVSVRGYNTSVNKELVNVGNSATNFQGGVISGDTDDVHVEYNGDSRDTFTLAQCGLLAGVVRFAGSGSGTGAVFTVKGSDYYANTVPVYGTFTAGDFYRRHSVNETGSTVSFGGKNVKTVELGRQHDGSTWRQLWSLREV